MRIPTPQEDTDRAVAALTKWAGIACEERGYDGEEERLASRIRDELSSTRAQLAAMREKLALLDPVLRKLWAAHGCIEGAERYNEIERDWAYAMELMDEMLPVEWVVEGEGQDGEY